MKTALVLLLTVSFGWAAEKKPSKASAGNEAVEIEATALVDPAEVKQVLGAALDSGFIVVQVKVTPKGEEGPLRVSPDDFQLLSHKDGQRSGAYLPTQIAGKSVMVVRSSSRGNGGIGMDGQGPIWGGLGGDRPRKLGGDGAAAGTIDPDKKTEAEVASNSREQENPLLKVLSAKILPDKESREPVSGLLYFLIEGKVKGKDLSLIYKSPVAGRLVLEFKEPK